MWRKLPLWLRAITTGFVVAIVPTIVWAVLAVTNLRLDPRIPWSAPAMAGLLWWYWRYVRGDGPPRRLAAFRREHLRANPLKPETWRLALLAGGSAVAAMFALFAALRPVLHLAAPAASEATRFPMVTVMASILMASAVAGIVEEAGFRGYMQVSLERAYGPVIAITTTSVLFTLMHLTHGSAILPFLPFYLAVAVAYSVLAYLTGSILPSLTVHFVGDVLMFAWRYVAVRAGVAGSAGTGTISLVPLIAFLALTAVSVLAFRLLARQTRGVTSTIPGMVPLPSD